MHNLIDLTHTFDDNMPVYPGDPCARLYQTAFVEKEGLSDHRVESGMHVGTHIDAPLHFVSGGAYICDIPLPHFTGHGHLIDGRGEKVMTSASLSGHNLRQGDIVLVWTDWSKKFRDADYYSHYPVVTEDFAQVLVDAGVSMLGLDTPSPDYDPFPVHQLLLSRSVLIIENLTNLEKLAPHRHFKIHAYPVKYKADAAPVRVVAEVME